MSVHTFPSLRHRCALFDPFDLAQSIQSCQGYWTSSIFYTHNFSVNQVCVCDLHGWANHNHGANLTIIQTIKKGHNSSNQVCVCDALFYIGLKLQA